MASAQRNQTDALPSNLLGELEAAVEQLKKLNEISDDTPELIPFLQVLEKILRNGLRAKSNFIGFERRDYWNWLESLQKNNALHYELSHAKNLLDAKTAQGKGRAFIRFALVEKSLADAVQLLLVESSLKQEFYSSKAFLLNEYCANALITILYEVNALNFNLVRTNVDLDNSWTATRSETSKKPNAKEEPAPVVPAKSLIKEPEPVEDISWADEKAALESTIEALKHQMRSNDMKKEAAERAWTQLKSELVLRIAELQTRIDQTTETHEQNGEPTSANELQQRVMQLQDALKTETSRNVLTESAELREKQLYYENLLQLQSGSVNQAELDKKDEEILQLTSELKHRRDWILQVELARGEEHAAEKLQQQELLEIKKQLEAERQKLSSIQALLTETQQSLTDKTSQLTQESKQIQELKARADMLNERCEKLEKEKEQLEDELNAESAARKQLEESSQGMERELERLSGKYEKDTLRYSELVNNERKEKNEFVNETQKLLMDFQREIEDEKSRRFQILKHLEVERARITMQKWTKDQEASSCTSCKREFSMWLRKHHCRSCGKIFCHACSSHVALTTAGPRPMRVCDECFSKLEGLEAPVSVYNSLGDLTKGLESFMSITGLSSSPPVTSSALATTAPTTPTSATATSESLPIGTVPRNSRYASPTTPRFGTPPRGSKLAGSFNSLPQPATTQP